VSVDEAEIDDAAGRIRRNKLLFAIYRDVYARILAEVPPAEFPRLLELGSGGGFFKDFAPHAVTSECVETPRVDRVIDACAIDRLLAPESLDAITAFNVFHHLPDATGFLHGASSVLRVGGRIAMIEPWFTPVGQWFYRALHHEPWVRDADDWSLRGQGRLGGANSRLPTSVFRDSDARFAREFPALRIVKREPFHKWLYLASGGLKLNTRVPGVLADAMVALDGALRLGDGTLGLFATVVVERVR
jgi:SAM-dependent methyltransferase